jgi:cytochrome c oxidase subunit 2
MPRIPRVRRRSLVFALLLALGLAAAGAAFAANGGVTPPSPRSPNAERINDTYYLILGITGGIFLLVETALILFIVRYRNRGRPRAVEGPQVIGHTRLELIWTVVPVLILAAIAGFVFYKLPGIKDVPGAQAGERLAIRVEGHQFYWRFVYPDGTVAVDRLRVPADRVVTMSVTAPDVVHSWWVPELGGKIDAIPGETTHTWFRARRPGVYKGKCAEFCGIQHAVMTASVEVLPRAEYARWLAERRGAATGLGEETFAGVCAKCHGARGQGGIGPALAGNRLIGDRKAIEPIIRNGTGLMPPVGRNWDDQQLNAVIAYMGRTLREESGGGG